MTQNSSITFQPRMLKFLMILCSFLYSISILIAVQILLRFSQMPMPEDESAFMKIRTLFLIGVFLLSLIGSWIAFLKRKYVLTYLFIAAPLLVKVILGSF